MDAFERILKGFYMYATPSYENIVWVWLVYNEMGLLVTFWITFDINIWIPYLLLAL